MNTLNKTLQWLVGFEKSLPAIDARQTVNLGQQVCNYFYSHEKDYMCPEEILLGIVKKELGLDRIQEIRIAPPGSVVVQHSVKVGPFHLGNIQFIKEVGKFKKITYGTCKMEKRHLRKVRAYTFHVLYVANLNGTLFLGV